MKMQMATSLVLAAALAASACGRNEEPVVASETPTGSAATSAAAADDRDQALIRVIHAIPGATSVDVLADDQTIATNVAYGTATAYQGVAGSVDDFEIRAAGQPAGTSLAENSEGVMNGKHYTLIAFPGSASDRAELQVVTDNHEVPADGRARVRIVNAAADLESVDVYTPGTTSAWMDDVDFREVSDYDEVDPATATLELRAGDGKRVLAKPDVKMEAGKSYTIVLTGRVKGTPALNTIVIEDQVIPTRTN